MSLEKEFNIERLAKELADTFETANATIKDQSLGVTKTLYKVSIRSVKFRRLNKQLARALDVTTKGRNHFEITGDIVTELENIKSPSATRLKVAHEWCREFWSDPDVKSINKKSTVFNIPSSVKSLKISAQKH